MTKGQIFVSILERHFKRNPFGELFVKRIDQLCDGLSEDLVEETAKRVADKRTTFPNLETCRQALKMAARPIPSPSQTKFSKSEERRSEEERRIKAFKLCRCDLGRQAAAEGWLRSLFEFAEAQGRLPNDAELQHVKAWSEEVDANLHREPRPIFYSNLCDLRQFMKDKIYKEIFEYEPKDPSDPSDAPERADKRAEQFIPPWLKPHGA